MTGPTPADDATSAPMWREDIDSLSFQPPGHAGRCVVHRRAFRALIGRKENAGRNEDAGACLAWFTAHRRSFEMAAAAKILRQGLAPAANLHVNSRDIRRALAAAEQTPSVQTPSVQTPAAQA